METARLIEVPLGLCRATVPQSQVPSLKRVCAAAAAGEARRRRSRHGLGICSVRASPDPCSDGVV